uniref:Uncharacterized protein n=1 Tax=Myotis myotis TaxID=51298 RepID=A0A7J7R3N9_MYOMY|nr:hypothetical protein mMyoMyo1_010903 [Myotis myotis]
MPEVPREAGPVRGLAGDLAVRRGLQRGSSVPHPGRSPWRAGLLATHSRARGQPCSSRPLCSSPTIENVNTSSSKALALRGPAPPAPPSWAGGGAPGDQLCLQHAPGWSAVDLVHSLCSTLSRSECWGPSCRSHWAKTVVRGPRRCVPPPPRGGARPSGKRRAGRGGVSGGQGLCPRCPRCPPSPTAPPLPCPLALPHPETAQATPFTIAPNGVHLHQGHQSFPTSSVFGALKNTPEANFLKSISLLMSERKGERDTSMRRETHGPAASRTPPTGVGACSPGLCPDRESSPDLWVIGHHSTPEPHQLGPNANS